MQPDLKNRLLANVLLDSRPEHISMPRRQMSAKLLRSWAIMGMAATGLALLMLAKLQVVLR